MSSYWVNGWPRLSFVKYNGVGGAEEGVPGRSEKTLILAAE